MASASIPVDIIEKDLTCSICLNLLQDPKDLDCPHTYCFDCLKQYVQKKPTIECPECRYITIVPEGGLTDLKPNLRLKSMVENFIKGTSSRSSKKQLEVPICQYHSGERQHFFCVTCNISICHNCVVLKHPKPQHEIRELRDVMEEEEKQKRVKTQQLEDVERKLKSAKDKAVQEVKSCVESVIDEVKTWEKKMNQEIQTTYQKRMKIIQDKHIELNRSARAIGSSISVASGMGGVSIQDDELLHDMTILHLETKQLDLSSFGFLVTSDDKKNANKKKQATSPNQKLVVPANKELRLTILTQFGSFYKALHVAANQSNQIAVIDGDWSDRKCSIYGNCNGEYKQQCQLKLDEAPNSVAVSSQGKIFVTVENKVKVFSSSGRYERSWPAPGYYGQIAITPDDIVVIRSRTSKYGGKYMIIVHQCDGQLIRKFQEEYFDIRDIASNGKHIAFTTDDTIHVIDFMTGHTLWTLNISDPLGICYLQNSNTLLVSRCPSYQQGVIEQYCCTTGRLISCLASGLYSLYRMTVTQDNKLVVVDWGTVKIYDIN